jgi:Flp pilus assembly protein TadB
MLQRLKAIKRYHSLITEYYAGSSEDYLESQLKKFPVIHKLCFLSGIQVSYAGILLLLVSLVILSFWLSWFEILLVLLMLPVVIWGVLILLARRAVGALSQHLPAFLLSIKSLLNTGQDLVQAIKSCLESFDKHTLLHKEFTDFINTIRAKNFEEAVNSFGERLNVQLNIGNFTIQLVSPPQSVILLKDAFRISSKEGASLSAFIDRVVKYDRIIELFSQKARSAVTTQKISAYGIAIIGPLPLVLRFSRNPEELSVALNSTVGFSMIALGSVLLVIGFVWMLLLAKAKL